MCLLKRRNNPANNRRLRANRLARSQELQLRAHRVNLRPAFQVSQRAFQVNRPAFREHLPPAPVPL